MTEAFCEGIHRRDTTHLVAELFQVAKQTAFRTRWYYSLKAEAEIDYESQPVGKGSAMG